MRTTKKRKERKKKKKLDTLGNKKKKLRNRIKFYDPFCPKFTISFSFFKSFSPEKKLYFIFLLKRKKNMGCVIRGIRVVNLGLFFSFFFLVLLWIIIPLVNERTNEPTLSPLIRCNRFFFFFFFETFQLAIVNSLLLFPPPPFRRVSRSRLTPGAIFLIQPRKKK